MLHHINMSDLFVNGQWWMRTEQQAEVSELRIESGVSSSVTLTQSSNSLQLAGKISLTMSECLKIH